MKKRFRLMAAALCAVVLLCGMSVTAYAGGGDEYMEDTGYYEPEPTIEPGEGFTEEGNLLTRDLLYDEHTNKQFITVETKGGNTFYIVIDYDKPMDEEGEQYYTYFLNMVDEADLLAALEAAGGELPVCECTDRCAAGAVNTNCPVCATNMTECVGAVPEPEPVAEPEPTEPEPEKSGGAGWYFKIYRPKQQKAAEPEEDYSEELDDYGDYDDGPPWDEDEPGEGDEA